MGLNITVPVLVGLNIVWVFGSPTLTQHRDPFLFERDHGLGLAPPCRSTQAKSLLGCSSNLENPHTAQPGRLLKHLATENPQRGPAGAKPKAQEPDENHLVACSLAQNGSLKAWLGTHFLGKNNLEQSSGQRIPLAFARRIWAVTCSFTLRFMAIPMEALGCHLN